MFSYGRYCPIAKSAEILGDRWTLLICNEILHGVRHFNGLHRGLPGISRSVLIERLRRLEDMGVIERRADARGKKPEYFVTEAGEDVQRVLRSMGEWGARWVLSDPTPRDTDPDFLLVGICRHVRVSALPDKRTVVEFEIRSSGRKRRYWVVLDSGDVSLCLKPPGFDADLVVSADAKSLHRVHSGRLDYRKAVRDGGIALDGPKALVKAFPSWMKWSGFADIVRESALT